jgi:hypothetical protein
MGIGLQKAQAIRPGNDPEHDSVTVGAASIAASIATENST